MDCNEEQNQEMEALASIFVEGEFEEVGESVPRKFLVKILPTVQPKKGESLDIEVFLFISYTPQYPNEPPIIELQDCMGIGSDHQDELLAKINSTAQESVGAMMVFTLIQVARDFLDERIDQIQKEAEEEKLREEREAKARQDAEDARRQGTPVTRDNFTEWNTRFMADVRAKQVTAAAATRLTGREMFLKDASLAQADLLLDTEETEEEVPASPGAGAGAAAAGKVEVDGKLFQGGDEDLPSDEDE